MMVMKLDSVIALIHNYNIKYMKIKFPPRLILILSIAAIFSAAVCLYQTQAQGLLFYDAVKGEYTMKQPLLMQTKNLILDDNSKPDIGSDLNQANANDQGVYVTGNTYLKQGMNIISKGGSRDLSVSRLATNPGGTMSFEAKDDLYINSAKTLKFGWRGQNNENSQFEMTLKDAYLVIDDNQDIDQINPTALNDVYAKSLYVETIMPEDPLDTLRIYNPLDLAGKGLEVTQDVLSPNGDKICRRVDLDQALYEINKKSAESGTEETTRPAVWCPNNYYIWSWDNKSGLIEESNVSSSQEQILEVLKTMVQESFGGVIGKSACLWQHMTLEGLPDTLINMYSELGLDEVYSDGTKKRDWLATVTGNNSFLTFSGSDYTGDITENMIKNINLTTKVWDQMVALYLESSTNKNSLSTKFIQNELLQISNRSIPGRYSVSGTKYLVCPQTVDNTGGDVGVECYHGGEVAPCIAKLGYSGGKSAYACPKEQYTENYQCDDSNKSIAVWMMDDSQCEAAFEVPSGTPQPCSYFYTDYGSSQNISGDNCSQLHSWYPDYWVCDGDTENLDQGVFFDISAGDEVLTDEDNFYYAQNEHSTLRQQFNKWDQSINDVSCPVLKRSDACKFEAFRMFQVYLEQFNLLPEDIGVQKEASDIYCCKIYD